MSLITERHNIFAEKLPDYKRLGLWEIGHKTKLKRDIFLFILGVPCSVAIPQKVPVHCHESRGKDLAKHRGIYKLGHFKNLPFPLTDINAYLLINLTLADPFTQTWMKLYGYMLKKNLALIQNFPKINKKEFTKISDYEGVYHFFLKQQQNEEMVIL